MCRFLSFYTLYLYLSPTVRISFNLNVNCAPSSKSTYQSGYKDSLLAGRPPAAPPPLMALTVYWSRVHGCCRSAWDKDFHYVCSVSFGCQLLLSLLKCHKAACYTFDLVQEQYCLLLIMVTWLTQLGQYTVCNWRCVYVQISTVALHRFVDMRGIRSTRCSHLYMQFFSHDVTTFFSCKHNSSKKF